MSLLVSADRMYTGLQPYTVEEGAVLVEDGRIKDVGPRAELEGRATEQVVLPGTLLPGLCDVHTHIVLNASANPEAQLREESRTATVIRAQQNLRRHLEAGVTTIRDMGGVDDIDLELRDAVAQGLVRGPRMLVAGRAICMTGGHGCWFGVECDGPDETRREARRNLKHQVDHLKVIATGGVMTEGVEPGAPQLSEEEMRAVCEEGRKAGRRVGAHAQGTEGIRNALRAGVYTIEHGFYIDDETVALFLEMGAMLVPTFAAAAGIVGGREQGVPAFMVEKLEQVGSHHRESFRRCVQSQVTFATGTDAGTPLNPHGSIAREMELMVDCGIPPVEALRAATGYASVALARRDLGAL